MLEEMRLSGLGVIEEAVLELAPGLTVVTGETGAGKTMVVTGLSLLLGNRADPGLVRAQAERAVVEGRVRVDPDSSLARRATDLGGELDEDSLILLRTIHRESGRSRAQLGGAGVPASRLAELAEDLVVLHGQSDQIRLLRPSRQREVLDQFAGDAVHKPLAMYRQRYERLHQVRQELAELTDRAAERAREAEMLRFGLEEIEGADPQPGEEEALSEEESRLAHADSLRSAAEQAHQAMTGDDDPGIAASDAFTLLVNARRQLDGVREHDPSLAALADRVKDTAELVQDIAAELSSYAQNVETDPARLAAVGDRRAVLAELTRKYGRSVDEVLAWSAQAATRLIDLDGSDDRITELRAERDSLVTELTELAAALSAARTEAGDRLASVTTEELTALAMPHAELAVRIGRTPAGDDGLLIDGESVEYGPHGVDEVELTLCPHPGAPPRPLHKGASGGELSRVMLALELTISSAQTTSSAKPARSSKSTKPSKVAASSKAAGSSTTADGTRDRQPTFVFDEVDAGVGGKAAGEIGRRLATLAAGAQVVVVTHLPQVAAYADRHYVVRKSSDGSVTRSGLTQLDDAGRVEELARMLAGQDESDAARAHAEELLNTAREESARRPS